jgi:hypothetical protein
VVRGAWSVNQFSLQSVMEVVTATAVVAALIRLLYGSDGRSYGSYYATHAAFWFIAMGLSYSIITVLSVWLVLGQRRLPLRCVAWSLGVFGAWRLSRASIGFFEAFGVLIDSRSEHSIVLQALLIVAVLFVFRMCGYRLTNGGL